MRPAAFKSGAALLARLGNGAFEVVRVSSMSVKTPTIFWRCGDGAMTIGASYQVTAFMGIDQPADPNAKPACSRSGWK
jgi:hypothetical protein